MSDDYDLRAALARHFREADEAARAQEEAERRADDPLLFVTDLLAAIIEKRNKWGDEERAARALGAIGTLTPFLEQLRALITQPDPNGCALVCDILVRLDELAVDEPVIDLLDEHLLAEERPREVAEAAIRVAGPLARLSPAVAATIAARARRDRSQHLADALRPLPLDERMAARRAISVSTLTDALRSSKSPALIPTATLDLDASGWPFREYWARTLVAIAGEEGMRHLLARMYSPGWSTVAVAVAAELGEQGETIRRALIEHQDPGVRIAAARKCPDHQRRDQELDAVYQSIADAGWVWSLRRYRGASESHAAPPALQLSPPLSPLAAVTSEYADSRRAALEELAQAPHSDQLLALLLGLELDRHLALEYRDIWKPPELADWLPHLYQLFQKIEVAQRTGLPLENRRGARSLDLERKDSDPLLVLGQIFPFSSPADLFISAVARARARELVEGFLDAGLLFATVPVPQLLTPDLEELYSLGPARYAERLPRRYEFDPAERAELEAAENAMAEQALRRFRGAFPELDPI